MKRKHILRRVNIALSYIAYAAVLFILSRLYAQKPEALCRRIFLCICA